MRRLAFIVLLLVLAGCSSKAKPNATGTESPTGTSTPGASSSASVTPGAQPDQSATSVSPTVTASTRSTSKPNTLAPGVVVPAPGTYHYTQNGSIQAAFYNFPADPQGTLSIGAPLADGDGKREQEERQYSSDWSEEQILWFRPAGVFIRSLTTRVGSGALVEVDTCTPSHPLKVLELPLKVGDSWNDQGTCNGRTVTVSGRDLRTETRDVGGVSVLTHVVNIVTTQKGSGDDITLDLTMWVSTQYGLTVHATTTGNGTAQGYAFKENLTEDLVRLTPDP
ncbi:MAG TPA: hypothetical protein VJ818_09650 [Actinomycetota bacterium]|nr:hypothetical protein [Actinomycetota bacterium]